MNSYRSYAIFLYTAGTATACIAAVLFLCWKLLEPGLSMYIPILQPIIGIVLFFAAICCIILYGLLWIVAYTNFLKGKKLNRIFNTYLRIVYPLTKLFSSNKKNVNEAYIAFLNHLVLRCHFSIPPHHVLILAPHCLQWDQCPHKITRNINNCHMCGKCSIGRIRELAEKRNMHFSVATGGTLARQIVREYRPQAIVAIACERDLISGMQDVSPLPVLGLLNERPYGPCFNTTVDIEKLEKLLDIITGRKL
ncbi:MAG: DUF116 domain-containing protein [Megasphaera sp.]|uniref:DUF116 domain-containing protein n=1 Tax=Megasphaera sueciensis TaxID=349094 RepID=UPI002ACB0DEA|nr:DUF116 domain-containing protein [Megasphaera sp.]MCI1823012.1 DUF116 domain-containing protein [Megasphaera sp.]